jgi:hypothetical protein
MVFLVAQYTPLEPPTDPPGGGLQVYSLGGTALNLDPIPGFFPRCGGLLEDLECVYDGTTISWSAYFDVIPSAANHLEVRLWKRQTASGSNPPYTDPACQLLRYLPLPTSDPNLDFTFRVVEDIPTTQLSSSFLCDERALWIEMRLIQATGVSGNPTSIVKAWPMYTAVVMNDCSAVEDMMPPADDATYAMAGSGLYPPCTTEPGFDCVEEYDYVACVPPDPPGSIPPPLVTIRNKRPLPPGTTPTYPSPSSSGTITSNDAP